MSHGRPTRWSQKRSERVISGDELPVRDTDHQRRVPAWLSRLCRDETIKWLAHFVHGYANFSRCVFREGDDYGEGTTLDVKRLRALTILAPLAYLALVEIFSILVLIPLMGRHSILRVTVIILVLAAAAVPFSFWIFGIIERQQRTLAESHDEVVRRNRQLAAINSAIVSVSSALELEEVLQNIVDAARELVQSRYGALGVTDKSGRLTQFITSGISPEERAAMGRLPQGHGLIGVLITEGKPLRVPDIKVDPRSRGFPPTHPPMTSLLGVPIVFQDQTVGDLYLTDKIADGTSSPVAFSAEDQELLMLLAGHAAVAIQNARLYGEARAARDRLQAWSEELEEKVAKRTAEIARYSKILTTRVLQAQEEERKRIARELHDETAQSLSTLLINLDLLEPFLDGTGDSLRSRLERIRGLAQHTLDETRALSHALRPTILDDFGLVAALRWFADEFTQTFDIPLRVTIEGAPPERLSPEMELALFRIAQEALTNSGKYADATATRLELSFSGGAAHLVIEDNGKGFDPAAVAGPTRRGGLGLYGMRERATLVGATLALEAAPGRGTRVMVNAPLVPANESPAEEVGSTIGETL